MQAVLAQELSKEFSGVRALDSLTLSLPEGSVFGFLGPNGAGKTTTVKLLTLLLAPTGGRCAVSSARRWRPASCSPWRRSLSPCWPSPW